MHFPRPSHLPLQFRPAHCWAGRPRAAAPQTAARAWRHTPRASTAALSYCGAREDRHERTVTCLRRRHILCQNEALMRNTEE